jgi:hypothetical protein
MAVFIEREHSAPDFAAQKLRQHSSVVAVIEAGIRPRKFIEQNVNGTLPDGDAKQDTPALIAGQLPSGWVRVSSNRRWVRLGRDGTGPWGRRNDPPRAFHFNCQNSAGRHGSLGGFRPAVNGSLAYE